MCPSTCLNLGSFSLEHSHQLTQFMLVDFLSQYLKHQNICGNIFHFTLHIPEGSVAQLFPSPYQPAACKKALCILKVRRGSLRHLRKSLSTPHTTLMSCTPSKKEGFPLAFSRRSLSSLTILSELQVRGWRGDGGAGVEVVHSPWYPIQSLNCQHNKITLHLTPSHHT